MKRWRTQFNPEFDDPHSYDTALIVPPGDDFTVQSFKDDADINIMLERFGVGAVVAMPRPIPEYGDFSDVGDYQDAMNRMVEAREAFDAVPARIRERFSNDPSRLLNFLHDESNRDEAVRLGLIPKPAPPVGPVGPPSPGDAGEIPGTSST